MKTLGILTAAGCLVLCASFARRSQPDEEPSVATARPVVVETTPRAGSTEVDPDLNEIRVTFSKEMRDESWSWSTAWKDSVPEFLDEPRYLEDGRTCMARVKLEPGRTYGFWLNSQKFTNFQDTDGRSAVPYLLVFETASD